MAQAASSCAADGAGPMAASSTRIPRRQRPDASSSEYCQTPPTASVVIKTRPGKPSMATLCSGRRKPFQLRQRQRVIVLQVAEVQVHAKVVLVGTLPGKVVRLAPEPAIVRRTGIGEERHRLVRPHALFAQPRPPMVDLRRLVRRHADEIPLNERNMALRLDQPLRQFFGGDSAALVEEIAAF